MYVCGYDVYIVYLLILVESLIELKLEFLGYICILY